MSLVPMKLPAGFRNTGTGLDDMGRWTDGSLVRWRNGSLRPIGGWRDRISAMAASAMRGMLTWQDQAVGRWIAGGAFDSLKVATSGGIVYDITPADLTAGTLDAAINTGFGGGAFGTGYFGQARVDNGNFSEANTWSLDTFGQYLIACSTGDGRVLEWQLDTLAKAAPVANAPTGCGAIVVTEERSILALGAGGDPRRVEWCDLEDNTLWTAASTNLAGGQTLQISGSIMCGIRTMGQTLILTDTDAHSARYVGQPFVYSFDRVGSACGVISRKAVSTTDMGAFWMGQNGFFAFDGSVVRELPCDVHDHVFSDINPAQRSKCWAMTICGQGEVWFFYPSKTSTECNKYVAFDYKENHWLVGDMARTSGVDRGVFAQPIMCNTAGDVLDHETGFNFDASPVFAESAPSMIGAGDRLSVVTRIIPDEVNLGDVQVTFKTRLYPTGVESTHGPYAAAEPTSVRFTGRQVAMRIDAQTPSAWRVGVFRAETREGSKR